MRIGRPLARIVALARLLASRPANALPPADDFVGIQKPGPRLTLMPFIGPGFRANYDHRFELEKEITAVLATAPTAHWIKALDDAGVPCGPVYNYEQLFADPQVQHREMVVHADDAELGRVPHIRTPIRMSSSDVGVRETAPRLGQHTDTILAGLGYASADIDALHRDRVV